MSIEEINGRPTCSRCGYEWSAMAGDNEIPARCQCEPVYNHACYLGFEVRSNDADGEDITKEQVRAALLKRIDDIFSTEEWREACLPPSDSFLESGEPYE
jgi:hypothetical protein